MTSASGSQRKRTMSLFRTPMLEISRTQEIIECLIILGIVLLILLFGQIIYQIERRWQNDRRGKGKKNKRDR